MYRTKKSAASRRARPRYECVNPDCGASIGVYRGTKIPLGPLANESLRHAHASGNAVFHELVKQKFAGNCGEAYQWLCDMMATPDDQDCHWGAFDHLNHPGISGGSNS